MSAEKSPDDESNDRPSPPTVQPGGQDQTPFGSLGQGTPFDVRPMTNADQSERTFIGQIEHGGDEPQDDAPGARKIPSQKEMPEETVVGRYVLQAEIARGGMGAILRGHDTLLGRELAFKVLLNSQKDNPDVCQRFVEEAQISGQLQHPGIVPVHELGRLSDSRPFFAMKLVKGQTLSALLSARSELAEDRSRFIGIFEQVCQTVGYAHSRKVIHRDLKPSNIMVGAFGEVQVMDWGLAKVLGLAPAKTEPLAREEPEDVSVIRTIRGTAVEKPGSTGSHTSHGSVVGTPAYMPPEQALGEIERLDERADVFGLGAILCEILTGKPPYVAESSAEVVRLAMRGKLNAAVERLNSCGAEPELIGLAKRCLSPEPEDRPRTAALVAAEISTFFESVAVRLRQAELDQLESRTRAVEERKRRKVMAALAATVVLMLLLVGAGRILLQQQETSRAQADALAAQEEAQRQQRLAKSEEAAKGAAILAAQRESSLKEKAEQAQQQVELLLADVYTSQGLAASKSGDPAGAMMWFASAAEQAKSDQKRQDHNRLRARNWSREAILPVAAYKPISPAESVFFQPAGQLLLIQQGVGSWVIWDWKTDQLLPWISNQATVPLACWRPDGLAVAMVTWTGMVQVCRVPDGEVLHEFEVPNPISVMAFSRDGKYLAVADDSVRIRDLAAGQFLEPVWQHAAPVTSMFFNQAGTRLITASADQTAQVFAINEPTLPAPLFSPVEHAPSRAPSAPGLVDGDRGLVTVSSSTEITWFNAENGEIVRRIDTSPTWGLSHVATSPKGNLITTGGYYGPDVWRAEPFEPKPVHLSHVNFVDHMVFSSDESLLLTASWDTSCQLWSMPDGKPIGTRLTHNIGTHRVAISDDNGYLVTTQDNGLVRVWQRPISGPVLAAVEDYAQALRISGDGRWVMPGHWHESPAGRTDFPGPIVIRETATGDPAGPSISVPGAWIDMCACSDSKSVAVVSTGDVDAAGWVSAWDVATGTELFPPVKLPDSPVAITSHPKLSQVAVVCRDGKLLVFNSGTGSLIFERHEPRVTTDRTRPEQSFSQYTPDGKQLIHLSSDDMVHVFDAETSAPAFDPIFPLFKGLSPCRSMAVSPDSRFLATGSNGAARIWDLSSGTEVCAPLVHPDDQSGLADLCFSPDGTLLLTANADRRARVWNWHKGALICPPLQHTDIVFSTAFTPDGQFAVTGSRGEDCGPHIWELTTGKEICPSLDPTSEASATHAVRSVAVTPDGSRLLAAADTFGMLAVINLASLLDTPQATTEQLGTLAELATSTTVEQGGTNPLTLEQWQERWNRYSANTISIDESTPEDTVRRHLVIAQRLHQAGNTRGALQQLQEAADASTEAGVNDVQRLLYQAEIHELRWFVLNSTGASEPAEKELSEARILLETKLVEDPENSVVADQLASLRIRTFRGAEGESEAMKTLAQSLNALHLKGKTLHAAGLIASRQYAQAAELLSGIDSENKNPAITESLMLALALSKSNQAETARQSYHRGISGLESTNVPLPTMQLAMLVSMEVTGKTYSEALVELNSTQITRASKSLTEAISQAPENPEGYRKRGEFYGRYGRWELAAADLAMVLMKDPTDHYSAYHLSSLLAHRDDLSAYREHCRSLLVNFSESPLTEISERTAMACLLRPDCIEDMTRVDSLMQKVKDAGPNHPYWMYFLRAIALYELRAGRFQDAVNAATESRRLNGPMGSAVVDAACHSIEAIAHHRMNALVTYEASFLVAKNTFEHQLPHPETGQIGGSWHDWLMARILFDEADRLRKN